MQPNPPAPSSGTKGSGLAKLATFIFVTGLVVLAVGIVVSFRVGDYDPSDPPMCGDEVMTPQDQCIDWSGNGGGGTYQEMQEKRARSHEADLLIRNIGLPVGGLFVVLAVVLWVLALRRYVHHHAPADEPRPVEPPAPTP